MSPARWLALALVTVILACAEPTAPGMETAADRADFANIPGGKLVGLTVWPTTYWGQAPLTMTAVNLAPKYVAQRLPLARSANLPLILGFPRSQMTSTGETEGTWSLAKAKQAVDRYASGPLKPDSVRKYAPWLAAWYLIDEPFCAHCWGGTPAKYSDLVAFAKYFRAKIDPDHLVPLAIRVMPSKLDDYGDWDGAIDVAWTVWNTKRGDPKAYMDKQWAIAQRYGWQMVGGLNAEDCHGAKSDPCTAAELKEYLEPILRHPGVCASINWRYRDETWARASIRDAWKYLGDVARSLPSRRCV